MRSPSRSSPSGATAPEPSRPGGGGARLALAALVGVAVTALAACGPSVRTLSYPVPPSTVAAPASTTTTTAGDLSARPEVGVPGSTTSTSVALGPGSTTLTGTVLGPSGGPVSGATVEVERLVGDASASTEVVSGAGGVWHLTGVLGGRFRIRAWKAPSLAMTTADVEYAPDGSTQTLVLRPGHFAGPTVTSSFAPDPATSGQPTTIGIDVTHPVVDEEGTVDYVPVVSRSVQLVGGGEWTVRGAATISTGGDGIATFVASCGPVGQDALTVVVEHRVPVTLDTPACLAAPVPTTTTTTPTTLPVVGTSTTTVPGHHRHRAPG